MVNSKTDWNLASFMNSTLELVEMLTGEKLKDCKFVKSLTIAYTSPNKANNKQKHNNTLTNLCAFTATAGAEDTNTGKLKQNTSQS